MHFKFIAFKLKKLKKLKSIWKIEKKIKINGSSDDLWEIISKPNNLELIHPFCKSNKIVKWEDDKHEDILVYHNGLTFIRKFLTWEEKKGYSLLIGEEDKEQSYVIWEITEEKDSVYLSIKVYPYFLRGTSKILSFFPYKLFVSPMLKSYLKSVIQGINFYLNTGKPVPKNYFGKHKWFS